jgi:hypothetical protein
MPRELAAGRGKYAEIDMNSPERERKGIPRNEEKPGNEGHRRGHALREEHYRVERTYSPSPPEESKLIVCGALHFDGLVSRFREREREVVARKVLGEQCRDLSWESRDRSWARMMRGEL